jgi:hypothetical protein
VGVQLILVQLVLLPNGSAQKLPAAKEQNLDPHFSKRKTFV